MSETIPIQRAALEWLHRYLDTKPHGEVKPIADYIEALVNQAAMPAAPSPAAAAIPPAAALTATPRHNGHLMVEPVAGAAD